MFLFLITVSILSVTSGLTLLQSGCSASAPLLPLTALGTLDVIKLVLWCANTGAIDSLLGTMCYAAQGCHLCQDLNFMTLQETGTYIHDMMERGSSIIAPSALQQQPADQFHRFSFSKDTPQKNKLWMTDNLRIGYDMTYNLCIKIKNPLPTYLPNCLTLSWFAILAHYVII